MTPLGVPDLRRLSRPEQSEYEQLQAKMRESAAPAAECTLLTPQEEMLSAEREGYMEGLRRGEGDWPALSNASSAGGTPAPQEPTHEEREVYTPTPESIAGAPGSQTASGTNDWMDFPGLTPAERAEMLELIAKMQVNKGSDGEKCPPGCGINSEERNANTKRKGNDNNERQQ
jgi:hypothetical protein